MAAREAKEPIHVKKINRRASQLSANWVCRLQSCVILAQAAECCFYWGQALEAEQIIMGMYGAPREIRTPGLLVRSQTLYPTELGAHKNVRASAKSSSF